MLVFEDRVFGGGVARTLRQADAMAVTKMRYGFGVEFDILEQLAYRAMVLHHRAGQPATTTIALGGALRF
jgi:hypothetical protein